MDLRGIVPPEKCTTVSEACAFGRPDELKELLAQGCDVDIADNCGWRPIHKAVYGENAECLQILLEHGSSDINWRGFEGDTPLYLAVKQGNLECARLLLEHGADCNIKASMMWTPILVACKSQNLELVKLLVDHSADVNCCNFIGATPLMCTLRHSPRGVNDPVVTEIVTLLLENDAKIDIVTEDNNATAVFEASMAGFDIILKILLDHAKRIGLDGIVNMTACDNATPLYLAAQNGHIKCVKLLLENGADANIVSLGPAAIAFFGALQFNHIEIAELLLKETSFDALDKCDFSPFQFVTQGNDTKMLEMLIKNGLDVQRRYNFDMEFFMPRAFHMFPFTWMYDCKVSPLVCVILSERDDTSEYVKILIEAGCCPNSLVHYDLPPLLCALAVGKYKEAKLLIEHGAHINMYHPGILFNLSVLMCIPYPNLLKFVLTKGAEVRTAIKPVLVKDCLSTNTTNVYDFQVDSNDTSFIHTHRISFPVSLDIARSRRILPSGYHIIDILKIVLQFSPSPGICRNLCRPLENQHHIDELVTLMSNPSSLLHLCRLKIRTCLHTKDLQTGAGVYSLRLPDLIKQYLLYEWSKD